MECCSKTVHRILVVEGNDSGHAEFKRIFGSNQPDIRNEAYYNKKCSSDNTCSCAFELDFCVMGFDAKEMIKLARAAYDPFKVLFIDISQSTARDYVETIEDVWNIDEDIQVVICADSSEALSGIVHKLGVSERLLILKKPYDDIEIYQTVVALSRKWDLIQQARIKKEELEDLVSERTCRLAEMNQQLMFAIEKVKRSEQAKDFFLENISKVVRTPLNSIVVNTKLLSKEGLPVQLKNRLVTIHHNANELMQVMGNILDMAEIESNHIVPDIQNVKLKNFLNELKVFELQAREKHIDFRIELDESLPDKIYTDPDMLRQCMAILLENAIKFTEKGFVLIKIALEKPQIRPYLVFLVQDTGYGISIDQQVSVFEPFTPGSANAGLGLGLAIAKKMVDKINGDIKLIRTSDSGTTFALRIPMTEG